MNSLYNSNNELIIKPANDVIFKKLFIENEDLLQDLVASIMGIPYDSINELTILNNEMPIEHAGSKRCSLDLRLRVNGEPFSIEIHLKNDNFFTDRSVFYWVKLFVSPLKSGEDYTELRKTVSVNIINFKMFRNYSDTHTVIQMKNNNDNSVFYDKFEIHFFELPKLSGDIDPSDRCDMWMKFINAQNKEDFDMITASDDEILKKAVFKIHEMSDDEKIVEEAFQREMFLHDIASIKKKAHDSGIAEGEAKGRAEGETKGKIEATKAMKYLMKNYSEQKSDDDIINGLVSELGISSDDARKYLDEFLE